MPEFRVLRGHLRLIYCISYNSIQMNNLALKVFDNEQFGSVRTITKDEQPWFVGVDVARALGYKIPRDAVNKKVWKQNKDICSIYTLAVTETCVCKTHTQGQDRDAETCVCKMDTQGQDKDAEEFVCKTHTKSERGNPNTTIINEAGVYQLIFGSKLESAKAFQNWVFTEVLPSIRKTGGYQMNERQVDIQRNYNHLVSNMTNVTIISQLTSVLATHGVNIGPNRMWEYLRNMGIVIKSGYRVNLPKIESIKNGLIESELTEMGVYINRLTPKGLDKVVSEILRGEKPIVSIALF